MATVTADDLVALRRRYADLGRRAAELEGQRSQLQVQREALEARMREEFGVGTLDELRALLQCTRDECEAAFREAEMHIATAEAALR